MTPAPGSAPPARAPTGSRRPLLVKKFGGTSVSSLERMREVARLSFESQRGGDDVVVVVSAMSGETDRLLSLARKAQPLPDLREVDVVAATGEQVSCALVAMCIQALGGKARSLLGHQLPMLTDGAFGTARIQNVGCEQIGQALAQGEIPVVAGFQGVDGSGNITTLGRGGSDASAVALAAVLGASACEIYTDVEGIYTADPRVIPAARKLPSISYDEMLELASLGARVLQARSVEIAMRHEVPLHVRSSFSSKPGTWVTGRDEQPLETRGPTGIACARGQVQVVLTGLPWREGLFADVTSLLADSGASADMLAHAVRGGDGARVDITFALPEGDLDRARQPLEQLAASLPGGEVRVSGRLAKVSLVGIGVRSDPRIAAHLCRSLSCHGIAVSGLVVGELRVTCLVDEAASDRAAQVLHDAFDLSTESPAEGQP
jgi:aspartate kinase